MHLNSLLIRYYNQLTLTNITLQTKSETGRKSQLSIVIIKGYKRGIWSQEPLKTKPRKLQALCFLLETAFHPDIIISHPHCGVGYFHGSATNWQWDSSPAFMSVHTILSHACQDLLYKIRICTTFGLIADKCHFKLGACSWNHGK